MRKLYCLVAIIGLFMIFTAPLAFSQDSLGLGGKWFQITFSAKGYSYPTPYDPGNLAVGGANSGKVINYFQFVYNDLWSIACPAGSTYQYYPFYEIHVWYPAGSGWGYEVTGNIGPGSNCYGMVCPYYAKTYSDREFVTIGHGDWLSFGAEGSLEAGADAVTILDIKRGSAREIKSATLKSYGCASEFGAGGGASLGSCTIKGKLIKSEKLPSGIPAAGVGPQFTDAPVGCVAP